MKILHIVMYENLYPPKNGGMLRCWNLVNQLSKYFNLDVLTLQNDIEKKQFQYGYIKKDSTRFLIPSKEEGLLKKTASPLVNIFKSLKYRWFYGTFSSADSNYLNIIPIIKTIDRNAYDIVIFEHLESLVLFKKMKNLFPRAIFIFDAHNIDHILLENKIDKLKLEIIKKKESLLFTKFNMVFACSKNDAAILGRLNEYKIPVHVIPNGIDALLNSYQLPDFSDTKQLIFCGTLDYEPNENGLIWFLKNVWPDIVKKYQFIRLSIVGKGKPCLTLFSLLEESSNIDFIGEVEDVIPYYRNAQCAIVPLLHGSGTRLKILEAMSLGIPVVSTSIGTEGINCKDGLNIILADSVIEFIDAIGKLYEDVSLLSTISKNGRTLIENEYAWDIIGKNIEKKITEIKKNN